MTNSSVLAETQTIKLKYKAKYKAKYKSKFKFQNTCSSSTLIWKNRIYYSGYDGEDPVIFVLELNGSCLQILRGHTTPILQLLLWGSFYLCTISSDQVCKVWSTNGDCISTISLNQIQSSSSSSSPSSSTSSSNNSATSPFNFSNPAHPYRPVTIPSVSGRRVKSHSHSSTSLTDDKNKINNNQDDININITMSNNNKNSTSMPRSSPPSTSNQSSPPSPSSFSSPSSPTSNTDTPPSPFPFSPVSFPNSTHHSLQSSTMPSSICSPAASVVVKYNSTPRFGQLRSQRISLSLSNSLMTSSITPPSSQSDKKKSEKKPDRPPQVTPSPLSRRRSISNNPTSFKSSSDNNTNNTNNSNNNFINETYVLAKSSLRRPASSSMTIADIDIASTNSVHFLHKYLHAKYCQVRSGDYDTLSKLFKSIEKKNADYLQKDEFAKTLGIGSAFCEYLFRGYDLDRDLQISQDDFITTSLVLTKGDPDDKIRVAFHMLDQDLDDLVSFSDVKVGLEAVRRVADGLQVSTPEEISRFSEKFGTSLDRESFLAAFNDHERLLGIELHHRGLKTGQPLFLSSPEWPFVFSTMMGFYYSLKNISVVGNNRAVGLFDEQEEQVFWGNRTVELEDGLTTSLDEIKTVEVPSPSSSSTSPPISSTTTSSSSTPTRSSETTTFCAYTPTLFAAIRKLYNITETEYLTSLGPLPTLIGMVLGSMITYSSLDGGSRSGAFFFLSHDGRYVLKTISPNELATILKLLDLYYKHLLDNRNSLLVKLFGLYKVGQRIFMVMENVFHSSLPIKKVFDLKGSKIDRSNPTENGVKKDNDFSGSIDIGPNRALVLKAIEIDVAFLASLKIMDYSLALGIRKCNKDTIIEMANKPFYSKHDGGLLSADGTCVYFLRLIDIFTEYNFLKKGEYFAKSFFQGKDKNLISSVPPPDYRKRFENYIASIIK